MIWRKGAAGLQCYWGQVLPLQVQVRMSITSERIDGVFFTIPPIKEKTLLMWDKVVYNREVWRKVRAGKNFGRKL